MKKLVFLTILAVSFIFPISHALSMEFAPVGSDSISMGGAGVASAKGAYAPYYNPALLAEQENNVDISFALSGSVRNVELAEQIDMLADLNFNDLINNILNNPYDSTESINKLLEFKNELFTIPEKNGLQIMPGFNLGCQIKQLGFGLYTVSDATATAIIDQAHNSMIIKGDYGSITGYVNLDDPDNPVQSNEAEYKARSIEYALDNGLTYIDLTGLAYVEIPISGGYQFATKAGKFDVGGSLKVMPGYTVDKDIKIDTSTGDISTDIRKDEESSVSWGIDLGLLYIPPKLDNLSIGLVGKNLNTPKFKTSSSGDLKVKPMARMGIAYGFLGDRLTAALDADLTKNETYIPGYYSQYIGGGVNFRPIRWISIRAGLMQNIQESVEGIIITGGIGLGLKIFQFDLSAQSSTKTSSYNGTTIPDYAKVQLGITSRW
jgi:hypothetical protein